ncbi:MAG: Gmad2 immunoglobulin-like domain-containing protein [Parcubacteria group bacterium]
MQKVIIVILVLIIILFVIGWSPSDILEEIMGSTLQDEVDDTEDDIGDGIQEDLVIIDSPEEDEIISSPLEITGEAVGNWFFEASFPIVLVNWDGLIIGEGLATAQDDWMTEDYVPFTATIEFEVPEFGDNGTLIFQKDNPSGLPENDDAVEMSVMFR